MVDTAQRSDGRQWEELIARALAVQPPYRPYPGSPVYHIRVRRMVDAAEGSDRVHWGELTSRALADPPPYRAVPGGAVCQIQVDDQVVMVAERDLAGPLLDLVAAVLDQGDMVAGRALNDAVSGSWRLRAAAQVLHRVAGPLGARVEGPLTQAPQHPQVTPAVHPDTGRPRVGKFLATRRAHNNSLGACRWLSARTRAHGAFVGGQWSPISSAAARR
jgi:hypothetical protein